MLSQDDKIGHYDIIDFLRSSYFTIFEAVYYYLLNNIGK